MNPLTAAVICAHIGSNVCYGESIVILTFSSRLATNKQTNMMQTDTTELCEPTPRLEPDTVHTDLSYPVI